jgi:type IV pilus assembly protein PilZ
MTESTEEERRGSGPRAPIELKVEYKRVNTFFADYTRNISRGGTFIRTEKPLAIGTEFMFALVVPNVPEPLRLKGAVQWVTKPEEATDEKPAGMGIRFVYESPNQRTDVEKMVERLMASELGDALSAKLLGKS